MKILVVDIETRPSLAYVWDLWEQNISIDALVESKEMLCFSAKWHGEKNVEFWSVYHDGKVAEVTRAWELLDEADAVVHYNGRRFDVPHFNREFLQLGMLPPSPFKQIDLLETVRKQFNFTSNKLAYVAEALGVGEKLDTGGLDLWIACMSGDKAAWKKMEAYNKRDVAITEALYDRLLPWIPGHPSYGAVSGENVCPACGGTQLVKEGFAFTATGKFQRYHCIGCGKWSRATKRMERTEIVQVTP